MERKVAHSILLQFFCHFLWVFPQIWNIWGDPSRSYKISCATFLWLHFLWPHGATSFLYLLTLISILSTDMERMTVSFSDSISWVDSVIIILTVNFLDHIFICNLSHTNGRIGDMRDGQRDVHRERGCLCGHCGECRLKLLQFHKSFTLPWQEHQEVGSFIGVWWFNKMWIELIKQFEFIWNRNVALTWKRYPPLTLFRYLGSIRSIRNKKGEAPDKAQETLEPCDQKAVTEEVKPEEEVIRGMSNSRADTSTYKSNNESINLWFLFRHITWFMIYDSWIMIH